MDDDSFKEPNKVAPIKSLLENAGVNMKTCSLHILSLLSICRQSQRNSGSHKLIPTANLQFENRFTVMQTWCSLWLINLITHHIVVQRYVNLPFDNIFEKRIEKRESEERLAID
ncbi:hypothetical protein RHMOL_Rhmol04G0137300 [Rhododendron molle]|uniref:Uncharacterized protein n=1 Tax=Rhododendron molle TaxID=49168 RepID=A0ACC0P055_RHOML|nr:hypothetical protein RHMOL_Rhmol04G0137300 [Rhododendron molle]